MHAHELGAQAIAVEHRLRLFPVAAGGNDPQALAGHPLLEIESRYAQPGAPVIEIGFQRGGDGEPVDRRDEDEVGRGQRGVKHGLGIGHRHRVGAGGVAQVDEGGQFQIGQLAPGLLGAGRQSFCSPPGQGFGIADMAGFAGTGVEEQEMRHREMAIWKKAYFDMPHPGKRVGHRRSAEHVLVHAARPSEVLGHHFLAAQVVVVLILDDLALVIHPVLEAHGDVLARLGVDHHEAQVVGQGVCRLAALDALDDIVGDDPGMRVGDVAGLGVEAEKWRNDAHRVADHVGVRVVLQVEEEGIDAGPAGRLAVLVPADHAGLPGHVAGLVRGHQDGMVEGEIAGRGLDLLVEGIDFADRRLGHIDDLVLVQLAEGILETAGDGELLK